MVPWAGEASEAAVFTGSHRKGHARVSESKICGAHVVFIWEAVRFQIASCSTWVKPWLSDFSVAGEAFRVGSNALSCRV